MLSISIAYSKEDEAIAARIANDLNDFVHTEFYGVETTTGGALLAGILDTVEGAILVLLSDNFLNNANCLFGAASFLSHRKEVLVVSTRSRAYDEELEEIVAREVDLTNEAQRNKYKSIWESAYQSTVDRIKELDLKSNNPFRRYADRVRGVRNDISELLKKLADRPPISEEKLEADAYALLFLVFNAPEDHAAFKEQRSELLGDLPGISQLSRGAAAGAEVVGGVDLPSAELTSSGMESSTEEHFAKKHPEPDKRSVAYDLDADAQADIWISRAWELYERGEAEAGLELLGTGRESLPDHPEVAYNYVLMLAMDTESPEIAMVELDKMLEDFHDHAGALFLSGELSLLSGNFEGAYLDWIQLRDVDPLYPNLNYRLGCLMSDHFENRNSEAITYLRRAARDEPKSGDARYRYGMMLYTHQGTTKKAIKWLKRAIDVSPGHAAAHYALAVLMHRRGKLTAARNYYRTAVHLEPAYDTKVNQEAFAQKLRFKSDSSNRGEKALRRMQKRIQELEAALMESGRDVPSVSDSAPQRNVDLSATHTAPAPAPAKPGNGKIAFISGATSGIGRATATALAKDGYSLILLGRRTERLEEMAATFADEYGINCKIITADVRDRAVIQAAVSELPDSWKAIDILINNAGKAKGFDPIHEGDYDHWDEMIDVNLKGLLTLTREVTPLMVARGTGTVINVCSTAGKEVYPNGNVYCATKHAVDALTYAMRLDLVKYGIRVGQICPAHVEETEFAVVRFDGDKERAKIYEDFQPLRSRDVAGAIRFMLNQPAHVNIMDVVLQGTQQASSTVVDRSGRDKFAPEEEKENG